MDLVLIDPDNGNTINFATVNGKTNFDSFVGVAALILRLREAIEELEMLKESKPE